MDAITTEKQPKYLQKTLDAIKLVDMGIEPKQALQLTNFKKDITAQAVHKFKKKYNKYSLTAPKIQKLAHNAITDCLSDAPIIQKRKDKQGNEIVEEIPPTWTNKIAAASMVYDRVEPAIRQNANLNLNVDVHPVDLSLYLNSQKSVPQPE
jgi:hypothetical protein